jgi:AcrR family transcriptional regulator
LVRFSNRVAICKKLALQGMHKRAGLLPKRTANLTGPSFIYTVWTVFIHKGFSMPKIVDREEVQMSLLRAAGSVLRREGIGKLTFEAIATEAGLSKGGVLHYFSSKQHVLEALVNASMEAFEQAVGALASQDPKSAGAWTRAYLMVSSAPGSDGQHAGYAVAWANDPALLALVQKRYDAWNQRLANDGINPVIANLIRLAADGLWQADGLRLSPPEGGLRQALIQELVSLTCSSAT